MNNLIIVILVCLVIFLLFKLRSLSDYYKDKPSLWPQYEVSGNWQEYKGKMSLSIYIKCLEFEHDMLSKILTNKISHHVGHPFNERNLILRSVIRDLKLLYNHLYDPAKFGGIKGEARYVHTFWQKLK